ncbi:hypothetical protein MCEMIH15_01484 [Caulobacteraceae bacterium]
MPRATRQVFLPNLGPQEARFVLRHASALHFAGTRVRVGMCFVEGGSEGEAFLERVQSLSIAFNALRTLVETALSSKRLA